MKTLGSKSGKLSGTLFSDPAALARAVEAQRKQRSAAQEYVAPRSYSEQVLAEIWAALLRLDRVGIHDNFFKSGGHSLLAAQMLARVRKQAGVELPLQAVFERPVLADLALALEQASQDRTPRFEVQPRPEHLPLSFAQEQMWFLHQLEAGSPVYNVAQVLEVSGELDRAALSWSVNQVVRRHESLRTLFHWRDDAPAQVILPELAIELQWLEVACLGDEDPEAIVQQVASQARRLPFDLERGPLLRVSVFSLSAGRCWLMLEMHHIISDRWSFEILVKEVFAFYAARRQASHAALPALEMQYADVTLWQRAQFAGAGFQGQLEYWQEQLRQAPQLLELPLDHPRPAAQAHRGAIATRLLPPALVDRLRALAEEAGATLFMTLLAGLQLLLARLSGQQDIVVGSPIANRTHAELEPLIGLFVNTIALRTSLTADPSFLELLAQVKRTSLDAFAHASVPFDRVVEVLQPERSLSYNPVFQVMFAYQGAVAEPPACAGLHMEQKSLQGTFSTFDLLWTAASSPGGTVLRVEYDTDLFDQATIERWLGHYERLLWSASETPAASVAALPLMDAIESDTVLRAFNANPAELSTMRGMHQLFEAQAARQPEATAVGWREERISYRELNERANRLAHHLIDLGVRPESTVGVFLHRTPALLVALLAVLKAGGAYVPLDPHYPRPRLENILNDAQARLVLTEQDLESDLPPCAVQVLLLDTLPAVLARASSRNPDVPLAPQQLAYVLFTSGSTGRPKGVAIEHRSAGAFLAWVAATFAPADMAGMLFSTSVCFDLSVFEIFGTLAQGGQILLAEDALSLPQLEARQQVTFINTVPSAIAELIRAGAVPSSVRIIALAGEALAQALVDEIYARTSVALVYNLYGPTEDTTYSTCKPLPRGAAVTIGRPIANTQAYVLDARRQPVPVGVAGELYLAGAGLARGYFGQPAMTAERFVPNPFSAEADARMYKTGDLCRWLPSGELEYRGRIDNQIKLRGFRIELGEIESVLANHSGVQQCLAMVGEEAPERRQLVAYVVAANGAAPPAEELRGFLRERLPEFMVPAAFVWLEQFPLTPNGKIDRRALPTPQPAARSQQSFVAPRTDVERELAAMWAEVLRCASPGVHDDFFALGGHSLLATQVISRVRHGLGIELPLREVFEAPTIAELAARIERLQQSPSAALIRHVARTGSLPLSFAQQRLWFLDQLEPNSPLYNTPLAIRMTGVLRTDLLERALNEIVRRHEILRTTFALQGDRAVQVIAPELNIPLRLVDLADAADDEEAAAKQAAITDARQPFDLRAGPLLRASLLRLGSTQHVLLVTTHHIVNDGWSIPKVMRELRVLYEALLEGKSSPLPALPLQYGDYSVWQREWMQRGAGEAQLAYWKQLLAGAPDTIALPTDRKPPLARSQRGATERVLLPKSLALRLQALSRAESATLYMTLLAAYQVLLFRYSHQQDIVVGSPIAGRNRSEIEDLIGFFVNTLVMRTDLSGDPTFRELLGRVRAWCVGAYANQDLPFEQLVESLHPNRDAGRTPLFQVWFALQNLPRTVYEMSGLALQPLEVHNGTAKFDLGMFVAETPDGLSCTVEYATDLFDRATIQSLLSHYGVLLASIVAHPDQRIGALTLLSEEERTELIVRRNQPLETFADDACIHQLFERQVRNSPASVAAVCGDEQLTYAQLNARANQLAHRLRAMGVGPETLIAICLDPSLEMLIAVLGVLKAGGAYLPVDTSYPQERQAFMLRDGQVSVVIAGARFSAPLPACAVRLDLEAAGLDAESAENPAPLGGADSLAYIIYTSGSTGMSKGVMIPHRNVTRLLHATDGWFGFGPADTWTLFHSIAFDFSVWEIWGALVYGGRLILVPRLTAQSADDFHALLVRHQVTVLNQTPSAFRHLTEADQRSSRADELALRLVIFGGEALELHTLAPWAARHPARPALVNMYGITETTVHVTYCNIPAAAIAEDRGGLMGTRIPDLQTYILDPQMEPVPMGVAGELYVGGAGLARGYLNRAALTAERFLPHPFDPSPGARVYRTGDLARLLRDGGMEYCGRIDDQVKIRGYRVELGEIEKTLEGHALVSRSVVLAREDEPGEKRLVAYVVARSAPVEEPGPAERQQASEQVAQWALAFDEAYADGSTPADATFNITGWDSSYTGAPIAADEMRVWVESTVARIAVLKPRRVWEIGCGTGLLLFRLAPQCEQYLGTDISQTSLSFLARQLGRPEWSLPQVELARVAAHETAPSRAELPLDTVILNSVVQYFPSMDYLIEVLGRAVAAVGPSGRVFIGDVRNLSQLELFHTSVELSRAPDALPMNKLLQRIQSSGRQEDELLLAPEFFLGLSELFPQIASVEIQLKRGSARNELTLFRYDVVLHVGLSPRSPAPCAWLDWDSERLNVAAVKQMLERDCPQTIGIRGIPNARLQAEVAALAVLRSGDLPATVGAVRAASCGSGAAAAIDPEDLWALEEQLPYRLELRPSRTGADGLADVLFRRVAGACDGIGGAEAIFPEAVFPGAAGDGIPLRNYANHPLQRAATDRLVPELRRWLTEKLPPYMVPSAFVFVDAIPLTGNGKVNKKALPAPDSSGQTDRRDFIAPRTPVEQIVAAIWEDVLHLERVGVEEDFFELGGHSLSATQVIARIRQTFQVELTLKTFFATPQVAKLAEAIERLERSDGDLAVPPINRVDRGLPIPLSFAQQRLWFLAQMEPGNALYNVPRAYQLKGCLDLPALERALDGLIARHEILRTTYGLHGDEPVQIIAAESRCELRIEDLSGVSDLPEVREREAARRAQQEADRPFSLAADSMLRVLLLRLDAEHHLLLLNTHHIASDGWSGGVLLRELTALYEAALDGAASPLPKLAIQYADYAVWQRAWLEGLVLEKQLAYWRAKLAGAPPLLALPTDNPRPAAAVGTRGAVQQVELPGTLLEAVRSLSTQQGTTPFMTLLAAFKSVLLYVTGQTDLVVGTDVANRPTVETEALIGFFVNLLVLRTDLSGDPTFQALLRRVRTVTLGAYAHQDVVFDKLVGELQPERSLTHNPLVQVLFVEQNTPRSLAPLRGVTMTPHPLDVPSKFDMALFVRQTDAGLGCRCLYNPDLFAAGTVARIMALFEAAIEVATSHPDVHLSGLMQCLETVDGQYRAAEHAGYEEFSLGKLRRVRRKALQAL